MSFSDYEVVNFSDLESVDGDRSEEDRAVVVELSPQLLQGHVEMRCESDSDEAVSQAASPSREGTLGPCQHRFPFLCHDRSSDYYEYDGQSLTFSPASSIADANSTISESNDISFVQERCKRCSFLNHKENCTCSGCGLAFTANPCSNVNEQISKKLQLQEESQASEALHLEAKKSLAQHPLFPQAQRLSNEIIKLVEKFEDNGFHTFSETDLTLQAVYFLELFRKTNGRVSLFYHFSKEDRAKIDQIRRCGFGSNMKVSNNVEAAFKAGRSKRVMFFTRKDRVLDEAGWLGWLVAVVEQNLSFQAVKETIPFDVVHATKHEFFQMVEKDFSKDLTSQTSEKRVCISSGTAIVKTLKSAEQCLPLVHFKASLKEDDIVRRLLNGLQQIFADFCNIGIALPSKVCAKIQRTGSGEATDIGAISDIKTETAVCTYDEV